MAIDAAKGGATARADRMLDAIERCLLPRDPGTAFQLLTAFIESEEPIAAHCRNADFGASQLFERAWGMTKKVADVLPTADVGPVLERLRIGSAASVYLPER